MEYVKQLLPFKGAKVQALITHHGSRNLGAQLYKRGMDVATKETAKIAKGIPKTGVWRIPHPLEREETRQEREAEEKAQELEPEI